MITDLLIVGIPAVIGLIAGVYRAANRCHCPRPRCSRCGRARSTRRYR